MAGGPGTAQKSDAPGFKAWISHFLIQGDPWQGRPRFCPYSLLGILCFAHSSFSVNMLPV